MKILVIAGPNGAGKTTFARRYLKREGDRRRFVNGDDIAAKAASRRPRRRCAEGGEVGVARDGGLRRARRRFRNRDHAQWQSLRQTDPALASLGISGFHHLPSGAERRSLRCACRPARSRRRAPHSRDRDPPALRAELEELPRPLPGRLWTTGGCTTIPARFRFCWRSPRNGMQSASRVRSGGHQAPGNEPQIPGGNK